MNMFLETATPAGTELRTVLRTFDATAIEREIRLRVQDLNTEVSRLEEAQVLSQELLELVVSR